MGVEGPLLLVLLGLLFLAYSVQALDIHNHCIVLYQSIESNKKFYACTALPPLSHPLWTDPNSFFSISIYPSSKLDTSYDIPAWRKFQYLLLQGTSATAEGDLDADSPHAQELLKAIRAIEKVAKYPDRLLAPLVWELECQNVDVHKVVKAIRIWRAEILHVGRYPHPDGGDIALSIVRMTIPVDVDMETVRKDVEKKGKTEGVVNGCKRLKAQPKDYAHTNISDLLILTQDPNTISSLRALMQEIGDPGDLQVRLARNQYLFNFAALGLWRFIAFHIHAPDSGDVPRGVEIEIIEYNRTLGLARVERSWNMSREECENEYVFLFDDDNEECFRRAMRLHEWDNGPQPVNKMEKNLEDTSVYEKSRDEL